MCVGAWAISVSVCGGWAISVSVCGGVGYEVLVYIVLQYSKFQRIINYDKVRLNGGE